MPKAILIYHDGEKIQKYRIDHSMITKSNQISYTFDGDKWPIDVDGNKCTYRDGFQNLLQFEIPEDFPNKELFQKGIICQHNQNHQKFFDERRNCIKEPKDTFFTRLVFLDEDLRRKIQILFLLDESCCPQDLPEEIWNQNLNIQHVRLHLLEYLC